MAVLDDLFLDRLRDLDEQTDAETGEITAGMPVAKKLAWLVRPAFIAPEGKTLVWGDFSNIEARVLPWLSASTAAEPLLQVFRDVDADPSKPDVYMATACDLSGDDLDEMWAAYRDKKHPLNDYAKKLRQAQGKVPVLSLGFGGGYGALISMAVNYGVYFEEAVGKAVVQSWRAKNQWAVDFWGRYDRDNCYGLWGAVNQAIDQPGTIFPVGRVAYVVDPTYLGGTLFCALPCGRMLTYPSIRRGKTKVTTKDGKKEERFAVTYLRDYGRRVMWHGTCAENITQASAASVLRRTLKKIDREVSDWMPCVGHTHDEAVTEVDLRYAEQAETTLKEIMEEQEEWDAGLPLAAEIKSNWYYTKALD